MPQPGASPGSRTRRAGSARDSAQIGQSGDRPAAAPPRKGGARSFRPLLTERLRRARARLRRPWSRPPPTCGRATKAASPIDRDAAAAMRGTSSRRSAAGTAARTAPTIALNCGASTFRAARASPRRLRARSAAAGSSPYACCRASVSSRGNSLRSSPADTRRNCSAGGLGADRCPARQPDSRASARRAAGRTRIARRARRAGRAECRSPATSPRQPHNRRKAARLRQDKARAPSNGCRPRRRAYRRLRSSHRRTRCRTCCASADIAVTFFPR